MFEVPGYGTADFVSQIHTVKSVIFGGFKALLCASNGDPDYISSEDDLREYPILIWADVWNGPQPRVVLSCLESGYHDWKKLLDQAPREVVLHRFVGSRDAARNSFAQWLTQGPSDLI